LLWCEDIFIAVLPSERNVHLLAESVNGVFQEEANEISLYQFSKMSRWGGLTSTPTKGEDLFTLGVVDFRFKERITAALCGAAATHIRLQLLVMNIVAIMLKWSMNHIPRNQTAIEIRKAKGLGLPIDIRSSFCESPGLLVDPGTRAFEFRCKCDGGWAGLKPQSCFQERNHFSSGSRMAGTGSHSQRRLDNCVSLLGMLRILTYACRISIQGILCAGAKGETRMV
jgi:hypothetical protein